LSVVQLTKHESTLLGFAVIVSPVIAEGATPGSDWPPELVDPLLPEWLDPLVLPFVPFVPLPVPLPDDPEPPVEPELVPPPLLVVEPEAVDPDPLLAAVDPVPRPVWSDDAFPPPPQAAANSPSTTTLGNRGKLLLFICDMTRLLRDKPVPDVPCRLYRQVEIRAYDFTMRLKCAEPS
jgi:hypothetical protein